MPHSGLGQAQHVLGQPAVALPCRSWHMAEHCHSGTQALGRGRTLMCCGFWAAHVCSSQCGAASEAQSDCASH
eukprot:352058-Chlamydomonas_euryale.AAC.1